MKTTLTLALFSTAAFAAPMKDRITAEALEAQRSSGSPVAQLTQQAAPHPQITRTKGQSLIKQSLIISDGTNWTLVPRGAVLHIPEAQSARVDVAPVGNLISWTEFLTLNRAWIAAEEISLRQAEGIEAIDPGRVAHWPKQSRVIVAVHRGGPISAQRPEPKEETALIQ